MPNTCKNTQSLAGLNTNGINADGIDTDGIDTGRVSIDGIGKNNLEANRSRKVAIALAFAGMLPIPLPVAWIHKFYLGQYLWGIIYLILSPTGLPKVACGLEGLWYASQSDEDFSKRFPVASEALSTAALLAQHSSSQMQTIQEVLNMKSPQYGASHTSQNPAKTLRELDQLRQEGLITEYEFEQKRRMLLDQIR